MNRPPKKFINSDKSRVDRRVQKTKKLLSQALIQLILEKGYERVTVQDILDKANVARSTFYTHYESKELLLVDGPRNLGLALFDASPAEHDSGEHPMGFGRLFSHVSGSLPLAKAMLGRKGGNILMDSFRTQIGGAIREHYKARFPSGEKSRLVLSYLSQASASAVCSLLTSWVDDDLSLPADEMSLRCQRMLEAVFREFR